MPKTDRLLICPNQNLTKNNCLRPPPGSVENTSSVSSPPSATTQQSAGESQAAAESVSAENPMVAPSRSIRPYGTDEARKLVSAAVRVAIDNNGQDVMVIDVSNQSAEFDFFILATGQSRRQLHAISEQIDDALEKGLSEKRMGIEGYDESRWIVLDYGSIVVHLFDEETREYYDLESLWADGTTVPLSEFGIP